MDLASVSVILNIVMAVVSLYYRNIRSLEVNIVKFLLATGLFFVAAFRGEIFFEIFWGILMIGFLFVITGYPGESSTVTKIEVQDQIQNSNEQSTYQCTHCQTFSKERIGTCKSCGAPL